jgi:uncharacterized repeat protein (TIGR01451 family)
MTRAAAVLLLVSAVAVPLTVAAPDAQAAGTVLFSQPFHDRTVDGPAGSVTVPTAPSGTNSACLTASGNATKNPLASCSSSTDLQGSGKLRFTSAATTLEGGVFASTAVPISNGLDVTFNSYQYGGGGADGLAFVLAAVDPANPVPPSVIGQPGGSLGYSLQGSTTGLPDGYLGIGFDTFGNYSNKFEGTGCTDPSNISSSMPGQVVVRGPGNGTVGYCPLLSSAATATSAKLTLRATTRAASVVPVEVVFNPGTSPVTTTSGLTVPAGDYDVTFTPVGGSQRSLVGALPVVPSGLYPSSWLTTAGLPKQLAFGWVGSTGAVTDFHEVDNVLVTSFSAVPVLSVAQTSYTQSSLPAGTSVTYTADASSTGATENQPVSITDTLPSGVVPVSAFGTGWTCGAPSGQTITCTSTTSPFTSGSITVNGVVTGASVTQATVQNGTTAAVSSSDASPATDAVAAAGTLPAAPTLTAISPTNGAAGGANSATLTGTNLSNTTAIEIGTTAQFTAGTVTTLVPCSGGATTNCFNIVSGTSLTIPSMPAHAAGAVTVRAVTLGVYAGIAYTYNTGPALLFSAPPSGEAGVAYSDPLSVTGGTSPFTWSIASGSLPGGVTLNTSTGLLSGTPTAAGTFNFSVKVTDSAALSDTKATSITIIPGPSLSFPTPPPGWTHTLYNQTLTVSGGTSPYTWSLASGSLPAGITLNASGVLTGTPTATGTFSFTAKVTDALGQTATEATTLTIGTGVTTNFSAPPAGQVGVPYSVTLTATGGTTPYTWAVNSGTLPAGLTLSSAGVLSGTPTTAGSSTFTVSVVDANNGVSTQSITLVINSAALSINLTASTTSVAPGSKVNYTVTAQNVGTVAYSGTSLTVALGSVLDDATYDSNAAATAGSVSFSSPNLTWTGNLAVGATVTITFSVTAKSPDPGDGTLTAKVTSAATGSTCPTGTSEAHCIATVTVSGLTIVQSTDVPSAAPGAVVHYTITVTNSGQTAFPGAAFSESLTGVLDDATYGSDAAATAGTVTFSSPTLSWSGSLAAGATATITFSVTVKNPDPGNGTLTSTITSATEGTNCPSGGTDTRCSSTVTVSGLTITNTASPASTTPGSVVSYTVTIANSGQTAFTGISVADGLTGVLDDAAYNNNASATAGSVAFSSPTLTWTGNLAAGATVTVTFSVTVKNPDTGNKSLVSVITSAAPGSNCPSGSSDSRCTATVGVLIPALTITKTADVSTTSPGAVVHYTVTVANTGQTAYTGATFSDPLSSVLGDSAFNNDASATSGSASFASQTLTWTGNLAVGATATITYSVTVSNPDTGDRTMVNTVTSTTVGSNCAAGSGDSRCTAIVRDLVPGLDFLNRADVATTATGQTVHYTITVSNVGDTTFTGASFTESLTGILDDAAYNGDGAASTGTVSFTSPTLTWTGNLAPGASATVTFSVTVASPDPGNHLLSATIVSSAAGSTCAAGSTDPDCALSINVAQLVIVNQANVATVTPGGVVRYTDTFTNTGRVPYTGITVFTPATDVFDDAVPNGDQTATSGVITVSSSGATWTGDIPVGGSVTVTGTVTVKNPDPGNKVLAGTVSSAAPGNNCPPGSTDPQCTTTVTVLTPALTIVKTASTPAVVPGGTVGYTITVTDTGQTPYTGVTVTDPLAGITDDAVYNGDATATAGTVSFASSTLSWTGNLAVGASVTITYTLTANDPDTGDRVIVNTVTSSATGSTCPPGATAPACRVTVGVLQPGLDIKLKAATATTAAGQTLGYTITATNTGQLPFSGVSFSAGLSGVLDDAVYNGDAAAGAGSVSFTSPALTWTGNVAVGATVTITFSVRVKAPDPGNHVLTAAITSTATGSNCLTGTTDIDCASSVNVAELIITATASPGTATPGDVVRINATFTNTGTVPYVGVTVFSDLADLIDDTVPNGDQTVSSGTLTPTPDGTGVNWEGEIPVGGTVTISGTVTVNTPAAGDEVITVPASTSAPGSNCPTGSSDPRCTATFTVLLPGLTIVKTADAATTTPGGTIGYTITVTDTGQTSYTGATVTDPLALTADDAVYNSDAAASRGTVSFASSTLTWTGNLGPGESATITYSITVADPDTGDSVIINAVSSAAAGSTCPPGSHDPACRVAVTVLTPGLDVIQSTDVSTAVPGQVVTYTITATNTGQTPYTGVSFDEGLSGVLDDASYDGDASADAGSVSFSSPLLTWTGDVDVGAVVTITFSVTVDNPDIGDRSLAAELSTEGIAGSNCTPGNDDVECASTVTVVNATTLTFTKTADVASTAAGGTVHYTITVANSGLTTFADAGFTDPLTGVLDDAAYNGDGSATAGSVSFSNPDLSWTGDVPANGSVSITYSVTVDDPDTGDLTLANTVTSASPDSDCPEGSADPRCTATVGVAQLTIVNQADVPEVAPGGRVRFTETFTNTGGAPYFDATIVTDYEDAFDDGVYNGDLTASSGQLIVSIAAGRVSWTGDILAGQTVTVTGTVTVKVVTPGDTDVTTTASTDAPGSNCPPGSTDPRCVASVEVLLPELTVVKTASTTFTVQGGTIGYTITVTDSGETSYTGATVADSLAGISDDAVYNGDAATTAGTLSFASSTLTWTGDLDPGDAVTITYTLTANHPDTGDRTIVNSASSSALGSTCPPGSTGTSCRVTVVVLAPALDIELSADAPEIFAGQTVTYTITATDTGQLPYTGAEFSDSLPGVLDDAAYNGDASADTGTVSFDSPDLTWTGNLAVGAVVTITFSVTADQPDPGNHLLESTIVSTATEGSNCATGTTDIGCFNTVNVGELIIEVSASPATTTPGGVVRLDATFTNAGTVPYDELTISNDLSDVLEDSVPNGDQTVSSGTLNANGTTVDWEGDIPVGGIVTISGTITMTTPDEPDDNLVTATTSTDAPGSNCPEDSSDPRCSLSITVLVPGLTITKTADRTFTLPGGTIRYTITVTDSGETPYTGATVTDALGQIADDAVYNNDAVASSGTVSFASSDLTWTGDLAVGASVTIIYTVTVNFPDNGGKVIVNSVSSADAGSTCPPGSTSAGCRVTVAVLTPAIDIELHADAATAVPGQVVSYTITAANIGQVPYFGAALAGNLSGVLDDAAYNGDAVASTGSVSFTSPAVSWTGNLAPGATATITFSVTVASPDTGDHILDSVIESTTLGNNCVTGTTDADCANTVDIQELTLTTTASVTTITPGGTVNYTLTAVNTGVVPLSDATFTGYFADVGDDANYNADAVATSGSLAFDFDFATVTWTGDLDPGQTVTVTGSFTVIDPDPGNLVLNEFFDSPVPGNTCPAGGTSNPPACSTTVQVLIPALTITKTADTSTTTPGSAVGYTITIANTGDTPYTGLTVTDPLDGVLNDAAYDDDAAATAGEVSFATPTLTWTGDLAVGATATVSYSVTISNPDTGDRILVNTVIADAAGSDCASGSTDSRCTVTVNDLIPALAITKAASLTEAAPGDSVGYTITVADTGETPYTGATVTDSLDEVLDEADYNGDASASSGTVSFTSPDLTWTGDLTVGETVTITYSVTVIFPGQGDATMDNTVTSADPGSTCPPDAPDDACTATVVILTPALSISKTADASGVVAGQRVGYSIVVTNTGEVPFPSADITDPLSGVLTGASYNDDATATSGTVSVSGGVLTWHGDLALDDTAVISYSVTTNATDQDGTTLTNTVTSDTTGNTCPDDSTDPACTATVAVTAQTISISGLTDSFTLTGQPGTTQEQDDAVSLRVDSNSPDGYTVSVQPGTQDLTSADSPDTIPVSDLQVRGQAQQVFRALSGPVLVQEATGPSAEGGDLVSNDYQIDVPDVRSASYSGTLTYIATATP